ncbi:30S ribosomal protein S18 [Candidatus Uhrbacteria bacterium]|nr:30S ribosomal protein S18 [Candidatus Uhrbacteria bacterium]MBT7717613.1 30S ribosomal protein S18 [Candidatus Uhrbacteria bacterium]
MKQKESSRYCYFCVNKGAALDYKNTDLLRRYLSSFGKIVPRKRSGVCMRHQRKLSLEIKRSRVMALLPFVHK